MFLLVYRYVCHVADAVSNHIHLMQERELARLRQALEACRVHDGDDFDCFPGPLTADAGTKHEQSSSRRRNDISDPATPAPGSSCQTPEVIDVNPKPGEKPRIGAYIVLETITVQHPPPEAWGPQITTRNQHQVSIPPAEQVPFSKPVLNPSVPSSDRLRHSSRSGSGSIWAKPQELSEQQGRVNAACPPAACQESSAPLLRFQADQAREPQASVQQPHLYGRPGIPSNGAPEDLTSWAPPLQRIRPQAAMEALENREPRLDGFAIAPAPRMQPAPDKKDGAFPSLQPRKPLWRLPDAFQTGASLQRESEVRPPPHQLQDNAEIPNRLLQRTSANNPPQAESRPATFPARPDLFGSGGRFGMGTSFGLGPFTKTHQGRLPHVPGLSELAAGKRSGAAFTKGQKRTGNLPLAKSRSALKDLQALCAFPPPPPPPTKKPLSRKKPSLLRSLLVQHGNLGHMTCRETLKKDTFSTYCDVILNVTDLNIYLDVSDLNVNSPPNLHCHKLHG
jgi:hypothetical protein